MKRKRLHAYDVDGYTPTGSNRRGKERRWWALSCFLLVSGLHLCASLSPLRGEAIYFSHTGYYGSSRKNGRCIIGDKLLKASIVADWERGDETEVYPTLQFPGVTLGMLEPEGFIFLAGTGNFAAYSAPYRLERPEVSADFGFRPSERRGIVLAPFSTTQLFWYRRKDYSETGGVYTGNFTLADVEVEIDALVGLYRYFDNKREDLSLDTPNIGESSEMLRISSALRTDNEGIWNLGILLSFSGLSTAPPAAFWAGVCDIRLGWVYLRCAGDYASKGYVYADGKKTLGEGALSGEIEWLPPLPLGITLGGSFEDKGVELVPDLYRESVLEYGTEMFLEVASFRLDGGIEEKRLWNLDGEGLSFMDILISASYISKHVKAQVGYEREQVSTTGRDGYSGNELNGLFRINCSFFRIEIAGFYGIETENGLDASKKKDGGEETFGWSAKLSLKLGENGDVYSDIGGSSEGIEWKIGWKVKGEVKRKSLENL